MQIPLQIMMHGVARSPALDASIGERVAAFERYRAKITHCRVAVSELGRHKRRGRGFEVSLELGVPGHGDLVVSRQHDDDVHVALRDAFDAALRQVETLTGRRSPRARS
jgi:ribosomal subunit interface protein